MITIGIDPAKWERKPCTYAVVNEKEELLEFGDMKNLHIALQLFEKWEESLTIGMACNDIILCCEDVFMKENVKTMKELALVIGEFRAIAKANRYIFILLSAKTWQTALGLCTNKKKPKSFDEHCITVAKTYINPEETNIGVDLKDFNIDHASAIHIAMCGMRKYKKEKLCK